MALWGSGVRIPSAPVSLASLQRAKPIGTLPMPTRGFLLASSLAEFAYRGRSSPLDGSRNFSAIGSFFLDFFVRKRRDSARNSNHIGTSGFGRLWGRGNLTSSSFEWFKTERPTNEKTDYQCNYSIPRPRNVIDRYVVCGGLPRAQSDWSNGLRFENRKLKGRGRPGIGPS